MCGIATVFGNQDDAKERVHAMLSKILHRGNSPYEIWRDVLVQKLLSQA